MTMGLESHMTMGLSLSQKLHKKMTGERGWAPLAGQFLGTLPRQHPLYTLQPTPAIASKPKLRKVSRLRRMAESLSDTLAHYRASVRHLSVARGLPAYGRIRS